MFNYRTPSLSNYTQESFPGLAEINLALLYKMLKGIKAHIAKQGTVAIVEDIVDTSSFYRTGGIPSDTVSKVRTAKESDEFLMYLHRNGTGAQKKNTILTDFVNMLRADGLVTDQDFSRMVRYGDETLSITTLKQE